MSTLYRMLCGCCSADDRAPDDQSRLVRDDDNYSQTSGYQSSPPDPMGSSSVDRAGNTRSQMTAAEEEQAILHRILLDTQAAVMDASAVGNSSGVGMATGFTERMQRYDQAMKRADPAKLRQFVDAASTSSRHGLPSQSTPSSPPGTPPVRRPTSYGSMDDVGSAAADILSAHQMTSTLSDFASDRQRAMREAMLSTMKVQHQEDLVVHMT